MRRLLYTSLFVLALVVVALIGLFGLLQVMKGKMTALGPAMMIAGMIPMIGLAQLQVAASNRVTGIVMIGLTLILAQTLAWMFREKGKPVFVTATILVAALTLWYGWHTHRFSRVFENDAMLFTDVFTVEPHLGVEVDSVESDEDSSIRQCMWNGEYFLVPQGSHIVHQSQFRQLLVPAPGNTDRCIGLKILCPFTLPAGVFPVDLDLPES